MTPARAPTAWWRISTTNGPRRVRFCTYWQATLTAKRLRDRTGLSTLIVRLPRIP